ncbi:MAG: anti-sigma factor antagonist [Rhodocyclaceae bacterium]|nr:MAG: anti-sigma factor antagonist [Rhodocyclaceae bacterium]
MNIQLSFHDHASVIQLTGRFEFSAHPEFRGACGKALAHHAAEIRVDLSGVEYMDSAALGMLLLLRDKATVSARQVVLMKPSDNVSKVLTVANFSRMFEIR